VSVSYQPISDALGAEVTGLDIRGSDLANHWSRITALLRNHHAVLFRHQELDEQDMERFARRFGELEVSVTQRPDGTLSPPVHTITNLDANGMPTSTPHRNSNYFWHSDKAFRPTGSAMVLLYGLELPPSGGDTQLANMRLAYEGLSAADKQLVSGLQVVHSFEHMRNTLMQRPLTELERSVVPPPTVHPMVRTDPATGHKSLLLGMYASEVVGMPHAEGRALLQRLQDHATQPPFVYTHRWRPGDLIVWDNLCLLHRALPNYDMAAFRRIMMRCGVRSEVPIQ
jgi:alpha-ketoglutarate-dependent taurine dioxygenase